MKRPRVMTKLLFHWYTEVYVSSCAEYAARVQIVSLSFVINHPSHPNIEIRKTTTELIITLKIRDYYSLKYFSVITKIALS